MKQPYICIRVHKKVCHRNIIGQERGVKSGHFCWITKDEIAHFRKMEGEISKMQPLIFTAHRVASERHPERNEDSFIADQESGLAGVFDGVGFAAKAKISASQIAAQVILQEWKQFMLQKQP